MKIDGDHRQLLHAALYTRLIRHTISLIHALSHFASTTVATRDIDPGEEFLLDYGEAYTKAFLLPKPKNLSSNITADVLESELPGGLVEEDDRTDFGDKTDSTESSPLAALIDVEKDLKCLSL